MVYSKNLKKLISIVVIIAFVFYTDVILYSQQGDDITRQFQTAKTEYNDGKYVNSKNRLERVIGTIKEKKLEVERKDILGKCYLLLGAIYEKEGETLLAAENYRKAKEKFGVESIEGVDLDERPIYKRVVKGEIDIDTQFQKAVDEYNNGQYDSSKSTLERIIGTIKVEGLEVEKKDILGKCYLLLGAIYEKKGETLLAKENYRRAIVDCEIEDLSVINIDDLTVLKNVAQKIINEKHFEKAKKDFINGNYVDARSRLKRTIKIINKEPSGQEEILGKCYLLLGIIYEKEGEDLILAEKNYRKAKEEYKTVSIYGVDFKKLPIYKKIMREGIIHVLSKPPKKKFPVLIVVGVAAAVVVAVLLLGKKKKETYTLTVTRGEGVDGTPASGTTTYDKGSTVSYSYSLQSGYDDLSVLLDGNPVSPSGAISMDRDHTLNASTNKLVSVHIESNISGAELYVNDQSQGILTPCDFFITAEDHELRLIKSSCGEAKRTITFEENLSYNINVDLAGYTYEFVTKWGSYGGRDGQFRRATGIALDKNNYVYVVDYFNHRIQKFDSNGKFISKWGSFGSDNRQFWSPCGIAVDENNYVYVADSDNERIQKFDSNGIFILKWGSYGNGNGQFNWPFDIAIDKNNYVYVSEYNNHRIQKFDSNGIFISKWGSEGIDNGQFSFPRGIAVDNNGYVYVADIWNHRIQKFDSNGNLLIVWGSNGSGAGQFNLPMYIAVDRNNYVYVSDYNNQRIQKFDSNGIFISKWGSYGNGNGQFLFPYGISVGEEGYIYVSEYNNNRIQKFRMSDQTDGDGEWEIITNTSSTHISISSSKTHPGSFQRKLDKRRKNKKDKNLQK